MKTAIVASSNTTKMNRTWQSHWTRCSARRFRRSSAWAHGAIFSSFATPKMPQFSCHQSDADGELESTTVWRINATNEGKRPAAAMKILFPAGWKALSRIWPAPGRPEDTSRPKEMRLKEQILVGDGAFGGAGHVGGKFGQHAAGVAGRRVFPRFAPGAKLGCGNFQIHLALQGVNGNGVTVLHEGNGTADAGFGRDVPDHEAVAAAGETAVGDERHLPTEAFKIGRAHV